MWNGTESVILSIISFKPVVKAWQLAILNFVLCDYPGKIVSTVLWSLHGNVKKEKGNRKKQISAKKMPRWENKMEL